jgi:hypothetical protein
MIQPKTTKPKKTLPRTTEAPRTVKEVVAVVGKVAGDDADWGVDGGVLPVLAVAAAAETNNSHPRLERRSFRTGILTPLPKNSTRRTRVWLLRTPSLSKEV